MTYDKEGTYQRLDLTTYCISAFVCLKTGITRMYSAVSL